MTDFVIKIMLLPLLIGSALVGASYRGTIIAFKVGTDWAKENLE